MLLSRNRQSLMEKPFEESLENVIFYDSSSLRVDRWGWCRVLYHEWKYARTWCANLVPKNGVLYTAIQGYLEAKLIKFICVIEAKASRIEVFTSNIQVFRSKYINLKPNRGVSYCAHIWNINKIWNINIKHREGR